MNETKNFLTLKNRLESDLPELLKQFNEFHIKDDGADTYQDSPPVNQLHAGDILAFYWTHFEGVETIGRLDNCELVMLLLVIEDSPLRSADQPYAVDLGDDEMCCEDAEYVRQRLRAYEE